MWSFMVRIAATAGWLALLLAGSAVAGEPACTGIVIRAGGMIFSDGFESGDLAAWGAAEARFQATLILDLDLEVHFAGGIPGNHLLHVKLLTPKGHHYQTLTAPIAADPALGGSLRRVEGYPRPLAVRVAQPARGSAGETSIAQQLPVAGTSIVTSALYGRWTALPFLDQATEPCGPAAGFFITP